MADPPRSVKERVLQFYEDRAGAYDLDSTFHPQLAAKLIQLAQPQPGEALLDLATGTGLVALAGAAAVGPGGRVLGVDLSPAMLQQAAAKPTPPGAAAVEWVPGDVERLDLPPASCDVLTCSSSLAFLTSVPATLAAWHALLKQPRGRLALNTFVAPALLDYATVKQVAAEWGLAISDPFEVVGNEQLLRELLLGAGFSTVKMEAEAKDRWMPADSPAAYAHNIFQQSASANPFSPINAEVLGGEERLVAFRAAVADAISSRVAAEARWQEGCGVRSPYTMLHVLATV